ncbi:hypothetical protein KM043_017972 [Ampulex compressa]|nr:hypothetical protein KM043_017972 [Ampulex compressa]
MSEGSCTSVARREIKKVINREGLEGDANEDNGGLDAIVDVEEKERKDGSPHVHGGASGVLAAPKPHKSWRRPGSRAQRNRKSLWPCASAFSANLKVYPTPIPEAFIQGPRIGPAAEHRNSYPANKGSTKAILNRFLICDFLNDS